MRKDVLAARWREIRPRVKAQWNRLTDEELNQVAGNADTLITLIEERYSEARKAIELELDRLLKVPGEAGSRSA